MKSGTCRGVQIGVAMKKNKRKNTQNVESVAKSFYGFFHRISSVIVLCYMLLILVIMPFYSTDGYYKIGTDKAMLFRKGMMYCGRLLIPIILVMLCLRLISYIQEKGIKFWKDFQISKLLQYFKENYSITDGFVLLYGVVNFLSYLFTNYADEAMWGTAGWYMGVLPQLFVVFSYFIISRLWIKRDWVAMTLLPVSAFVFLLGYFNRFGIFRLDLRVDKATFISTIGNINWYCGYFMCTFFFGLYLFWQKQWKKSWQKGLLAGYVAIGFATLTTQGSNSGFFAMGAMFLVLFWLSAGDVKKMERFWEIAVLFFAPSAITYLLRITGLFEITFMDGVVDLFTYTVLPCIMTVVSVVCLLGVKKFAQKGNYPVKAAKLLAAIACWGAILLLVVYAVLLIVNTVGDGVISKVTGLPLDDVLTFKPYWGSRRGATWMAGAKCFLEQDFIHKLIGVGPDCMSIFMYQDGSEALRFLVDDTFGTDRLTNAHNEWLTQLLNLGVLGAAAYLAVFVSALKRYRGMLLGVLALGMYLVHSLVSFQQVMNAPLLFLVLGLCENQCRRAELIKQE